jgi:hypothetical protein
MKTAKINDVFLYEGKIVKVTGIAEGKMIIMEYLEAAHLGQTTYQLEHSPNFQNGAKPIGTIAEE